MTSLGHIADASLKATLAAAQSEVAYLKERYAAALEREKVLLERLSALEWKPITPENEPKLGDEVYSSNDGDFMHVQTCDLGTGGEWLSDGWTHFRPTAPPSPASPQEGTE